MGKPQEKRLISNETSNLRRSILSHFAPVERRGLSISGGGSVNGLAGGRLTQRTEGDRAWLIRSSY